MKAKDLKKGSIVEIPVNISPEQMNVPTQVTITRCTDHYIWFNYNQLQRMGRNTFDSMASLGYKIISL